VRKGDLASYWFLLQVRSLGIIDFKIKIEDENIGMLTLVPL